MTKDLKLPDSEGKTVSSLPGKREKAALVSLLDPPPSHLAQLDWGWDYGEKREGLSQRSTFGTWFEQIPKSPEFWLL